MTRRQVYFWDKGTGKFYVSPEFNGDKSEFLKIGSADSCDKDTVERCVDLRHTSSLFDFMRVVHMIYGSYHSSIGDLPALGSESLLLATRLLHVMRHTILLRVKKESTWTKNCQIDWRWNERWHIQNTF